MADPRGFMTTPRKVAERRPVAERIHDWQEVYPGTPGRALLPIISEQAGRCMDCGIPFCHTGCPLGNLIPEWNDLVWRRDWDEALERLHATNNFPEFTGRLCPAPCETACVVGINRDPVTIKNVEVAIIDKAWDERRVKPQPPEWHTGKTVAVIGSGPAGLAVAQQLTRAGHTVAVFERADEPGGLMRYGIPEFKMEKAVLDRRIRQMKDEGTNFRCGVEVGVKITGRQLKERYDAVVLATGSTVGRDLPVPGRELNGIHQAMEFLPQANRVALGGQVENQITRGGQARGDHRRRRHRCGLPGHRDPSAGRVDRPAGDHADAAGRAAGPPAVADVPDDLPGVLGARGGGGAGLLGLHLGVQGRRERQRQLADHVGGEVRRRQDGRRSRAPSRRFRPSWCCWRWASPARSGTPWWLSSGCRLDERGNIARDKNYATDVDGVFVCGDAGRGQSLIVWAIAEGRACAAGVDEYLSGSTKLPRPIPPTARQMMV